MICMSALAARALHIERLPNTATDEFIRCRKW